MVADAVLTRAPQKLRQLESPPAANVTGDIGSMTGWELRRSSVQGSVRGSGLRERGERSWQLSTLPVAPNARCSRPSATSNIARYGTARLLLLLHGWLRLSASLRLSRFI
ncbi:hypothetical protein NDU88_006100 [Pleurodeles waltl]|uniref:Uncharacterized protein n=1 Tax=Pleurodeles waltl TaxID=8319 RepID=A0AAV7VNX9_PLEWA|nr:hypothetical protein NDU88_006100 [Pleurodeles waltl]